MRRRRARWAKSVADESVSSLGGLTTRAKMLTTALARWTPSCGSVMPSTPPRVGARFHRDTRSITAQTISIASRNTSSTINPR